jgi:Apea-like HEPN
MTAFPALREALHAWILEAVAVLAADHDAPYEGFNIPEWKCDADGVFRNIARPLDGWDFHKLRQLQQLASWPNVEKAFQEDGRLNRQIDTFVGTIQGGRRAEGFNLATRFIPRPSEIDRSEEVFEQRYAQLETYLAADKLDVKTIWPVPGLIIGTMPIELEPGIVLDAMSDRELVTALKAGIIRPPFGGEVLFQPEPASRSCIRYRYRLPKLIGSRGDDASVRFQELEQRFQDIRATIDESLALVLPEPVMTAGRFGTSGEQWSPVSGGVTFQQAMMPRYAHSRRIEVGGQRISELQQVWKQVSQRGLLGRHKGLALALRRLSYQAQRERPEDELLDIMIAAEALYLTELGNEPYRGELRYRLALRAAVWADEPQLGLTKYEVLKLMQSAYDTRSAVAHGGNPNPKIMKTTGERFELPELVKVTRTVVAAGCRKALAAATDSNTGWPPDWDVLALGGDSGPGIKGTGGRF